MVLESERKYIDMYTYVEDVALCHYAEGSAVLGHGDTVVRFDVDAAEFGLGAGDAADAGNMACVNDTKQLSVGRCDPFPRGVQDLCAGHDYDDRVGMHDNECRGNV